MTANVTYRLSTPGIAPGTTTYKNLSLTNAEIDGNIKSILTDIDLKATIDSPTFTGTPTSTTPDAGDNTTKIATTAFVSANSVLKTAAATAGTFDYTATTPTGTTRLNYGGYFYPTFLNLVGSGDTVTAATHYFVETGTDGYVRPKLLADVKTEIVTTAAVNAAAATAVGTVGTGTWSATTIAVNKGGTGLTSYAVGDLVYASAAGTLSSLADVATGSVLISGGIGLAPTYGKIGLTSHVTGTLALGSGGTGQTTAQAAINSLTGGVANATYLRGNGTNVVMSAIQAADVPTLNQSTTGTATNAINLDGTGTARTAAAASSGYGLWSTTPITYGTLMSASTDITYGGRITGETTSDYNMYLTMSGGINRGFVFRSAYGTNLFSINPDGVRSTLALTATSFNLITGLASVAPPNMASAAVVGTSTLAARQDHVHILPPATATVRGGIELFSDTAQTTAANIVTTTASRTYGIQINSDGQAVVNVPWVDTDTDTVYTHPTTAGNLHIPAGGSAGNILRWSAEGTAVWGADTDTVYTHPTYTYSTPTADAVTTLASIPLITTLTQTNGHVTGGTMRKLVAGSNVTITPAADGNITIASTYTDTNTTYSAGTGLTLSTTTFSVNYGVTSTTACAGNDIRLSDARAPTSHTHGNITNAGAIGVTASLPIITTTSGVLTTGSFGTAAATFCQGNDIRLSDARAANGGTSTNLSGGTVAATTITASNTANATSTTTGAIQSSGGIAAANNVFAGGSIISTSSLISRGSGAANSLCVGLDLASYDASSFPVKWNSYVTVAGVLTTRYSYNGSLNGHYTTLDTSGNFTATGNVTAYSDARLKTDLEVIPDAVSKVQQLTGYTYTRIDSGERQTGVIAQDLIKVLPEAVNDSGEYMSVAYGNMVGLLIEAIKELKAEIEVLKGNNQ